MVRAHTQELAREIGEQTYHSVRNTEGYLRAKGFQSKYEQLFGPTPTPWPHYHPSTGRRMAYANMVDVETVDEEEDTVVSTTPQQTHQKRHPLSYREATHQS